MHGNKAQDDGAIAFANCLKVNKRLQELEFFFFFFLLIFLKFNLIKTIKFK